MFTRMCCKCLESTVIIKAGRNGLSCDFYRLIGNSAVRWTSEVKMCKMMKKVMKNNAKKKWHGVSNTKAALYTPSVGVADQGFSPISAGQRRRAEHVGAVLYDYIISLVNSGELHPDIVDSAVEISKVKVVADFSAVNVFWLATGTDADKQTQELLDQCSWRLRQMLTSLRLIGQIPLINFVKDMSQARLTEVETLLKMADMGPKEEDEDDIQTAALEILPETYNKNISGSLSRRINTDFQKFSQMSFFPNIADNEGEAIQRIDASPNSDLSRLVDTFDQDSDGKLSPYAEEAKVVAAKLHFRNNIYDLDRADLMNRIMISKNKARDRNFTLQSPSVEKLDLPNESIQKTPISSDGEHSHNLKAQLKVKPAKSFYSVSEAYRDVERSWDRFSDEEDVKPGNEVEDDHFLDDDDDGDVRK